MRNQGAHKRSASAGFRPDGTSPGPQTKKGKQEANIRVASAGKGSVASGDSKTAKATKGKHTPKTQTVLSQPDDISAALDNKS